MFQRLGPTRLGPPFSKVWQAWHCLAVAWPFSTEALASSTSIGGAVSLAAASSRPPLLLDRDRVAGLGRLLGRENGAGADIERERDQAGAEDGAEDLVEFEGIHRIDGSRERARDGWGRLAAEGPGGGGQIPVCLGAGNPYKRRGQSTIRQVRPGEPAAEPMPDTIILIPARMASTRLPGKPLADIAGLPMIVHVLRRAQAAKIGEAVVATDSEAVAAAVEKAGGRAVMTRADHVSGSDRIYRGAGGARSRTPHRHRGQCAGRPADHRARRHPRGARRRSPTRRSISRRSPPRSPTRPSAPIRTWSRSTARRSRPAACAPTRFTRADATGPGPHYHHIGLYAYRRAALERFVKLPPSANEQREKLEQLRALDAGMRIDVAMVESVPLGVDTPEELAKARALLAG